MYNHKGTNGNREYWSEIFNLMLSIGKVVFITCKENEQNGNK